MIFEDVPILHGPVLATLVAVYVILIITSLSAHYLYSWEKFDPEDTVRLETRILAWWYISLGFTLALFFGRGGLIIFFALLSYSAFKEYISMTTQRIVDRRAVFWGYIAVPCQFLWVYLDWYGMFIIFIPIYAFFFTAFRLILARQVKNYLHAVSILQWGMMVTIFSLSHVAFCLNLGDSLQVGLYYVLYLLILTAFNDMAQFFWGTIFGNHKVSPKTNPAKTWEGFVGGILTTILLAVLLGSGLTQFTLEQSVAAGFIISVSGFFGDLTFSFIKRNLGVKDFSNVLPGHGGVLGRVDSLMYTAPLFFHYVYYGVF